MEGRSMRSSRYSVTSSEDAAERESATSEYPPGSPASKSHHYTASVSSDEGRASVRSVRTFRAGSRRSITGEGEPSSANLTGFQPFRGTSLDLSSSSRNSSRSHQQEVSAVSDSFSGGGLSWTRLDHDVSFKSQSSSGSLASSDELPAKLKDLNLRREADEKKTQVTAGAQRYGRERSRWPQEIHMPQQLPNRATHSPAEALSAAAKSASQKNHSSEFPLPSPADSPCCHSNRQKQEADQGEKKKRASRRHCRPVLGGTHFIICYECQFLIQMPEDFHFSARRRSSKLRCGNERCGKVLSYSIVDGKYIVPRNVDATPTQLPPLGKGKHVGPTSARSKRGGDASTERGGRGQRNQESYTEESGPPFSSSSSIETELELMARHQAEEDQKPLHRLMGYVSARDIMYPL